MRTPPRRHPVQPGHGHGTRTGPRHPDTRSKHRQPIACSPRLREIGGTVAGLSRRAFLSQAAALAALTGVETHTLGGLLAAPLVPTADAVSTLVGTVRQGAVTTGSYRRLVSGPGEPYLARLDVLGRRRTTSTRVRPAARWALGLLAVLVTTVVQAVLTG